jgi:hypothetical protein
MANTGNFDPCESKLRLFMSVDIVGSTAFKQADLSAGERQQNTSEPPSASWFSPIAQFYKQIELRFAGEWRAYAERENKPTEYAAGDPPVFWKGIGDEVVYVKDIMTHLEAYCCIHCWMNAINSYRQELRRKYPKLDLKSTAWIAGFPVSNSEIILRTNVATAEEEKGGTDPVYDNVKLLRKYHTGNKESLVREFIGPSIDIGFRLASFASPRKLIISVDLALILAAADPYRPHSFLFGPMAFFFDGPASLKGVLGGVPYPIIWIDLLTSDKLEQAEDNLSGRRKVPATDLFAYCEEFIAKHYPRIIRPYIGSGTDPRFSTMPTEHQQRISALKGYVGNEAEREKELDQSDEIQNQVGLEVPEGELNNMVSALMQGARGAADSDVGEHIEKDGTAASPPEDGTSQ